MKRRETDAPKVKPGLDVLLGREIRLVRGRRVGLVTNQSAVTGEAVHAVDVFLQSGIHLAALYAPEHGIRGDAPEGAEVESTKDPRTGIPVYSLYAAIRKPTPEMLRGVDVVLFDIQDIGCRFYTYIYTMSYVMQACAENRKPMIVLDRPNPINGFTVEGNIVHSAFTSSVGMHPIPVRHGMTAAELALLFNDQYRIGTPLDVVPCESLKRKMWFNETGLAWVPPSSGIPTPDTALAYPGICFVEGTNASEGRGTLKPFELVGAPWADAYALADRLNDAELPGVRFRPTQFTPTSSKYAHQQCEGVQMHVLDRDAFRPVHAGLHVVKSLHDLFPKNFRFRPPGPARKYFFDLLAGTDKVRLGIQASEEIDDIADMWYEELRAFMFSRQRYWLYS